MTDHDHDTVRALRQAADQHRYQGTVDVAGVVRSGARRRREQARHRTVLAASLTTAGVVAAVIVSVGVATGPGRGASISPSGPGGPVAALSLLARPPVAGDEIPAVNDSVTEEAEPYGVVRGSTRLVVEADGVGYYAGVDPQGEVCVVVHLRAQNQVASSCAPPERFDDLGVWISTSNDSGIDVTGLLLPDRLRDPAPGDLDGLLERAGTGAQGEGTLLAPNLLAVVNQPAATAAPTATEGTPPTEDAAEPDAAESATVADVTVAQSFVDFAAEPTPERAAAVGFADSVALGLGSQILADVPSANLADPAAWELDVDLFAGHVGPFSALQVLRDDDPDPAGADPVFVGPDYDHCAGPPRPGPALRPQVSDRLLVLQPGHDQIDSCLGWYAVEVHLDPAGQVSAVVLDLWEP